MREAIGSTWIFQLVLIFILIFASYLALTINYSKSFRIKNEVLTIMEKYEGLTNSSYQTINNYLATSNYQEFGNCPEGWYGIKSLEAGRDSGMEIAVSGTKYYWCFQKFQGTNINFPERAYYKIKLFFKFDLPVIGQIATFDVDGQTYEMDHTYDKL